MPYSDQAPSLCFDNCVIHSDSISRTRAADGFQVISISMFTKEVCLINRAVRRCSEKKSFRSIPGQDSNRLRVLKGGKESFT
jgi:hypothetical protein